jgi:hypothetical protein
VLHPGVDPSCATCQGRAWVVGRQDELAVASTCPCVGTCTLCRGTTWVARSEPAGLTSPARAILGTTNYGVGAATGRATPNMALPEDSMPMLADRVGARVYSRLREMCEFSQIRGEDYRDRLATGDVDRGTPAAAPTRSAVPPSRIR